MNDPKNHLKLLLILFIGATLAFRASAVSVTTIFSTDTIAKASEVNENFADLVTAINALESKVAALETKLLAVTDDGTDFIITGRNVHIRNGGGSTWTANSLGNLILGYNEDVGADGADTRSGSHNLVIGAEHTFSSFAGLVTGYDNEIAADYATVTAGTGNIASGVYASVSGGSGNTASGTYATVSGGNLNVASGGFASIGGGASNTADGGNSTVAGGVFNLACGDQSAILGGATNVTGDNGGAGGTCQNSATSGRYATVSGGNMNTAIGTQSSVSGGTQNTASGGESSVSGGRVNVAGGLYSAVSGGNSCGTVIAYDWRVGNEAAGCSTYNNP